MGGAHGGRATPGGLSAIGAGAGCPSRADRRHASAGAVVSGALPRGPERIRSLCPDAPLAWSLVAPSGFAAGTRPRAAPFETRRRIG